MVYYIEFNYRIRNKTPNWIRKNGGLSENQKFVNKSSLQSEKQTENIAVLRVSHFTIMH